MSFNSIEFLFFFIIVFVLYWSFFNLTIAATDINDYKNIWSQIRDQPNNLYVFSIKVHDIGKIKSNDIIIKNSFNHSSKVSFKSKLIALISKSELMYLVKDMLHQLYMWWVNTPNLKIFQSPLITNKKESLNCRNVHQNSASMKEVFNFFKKKS